MKAFVVICFFGLVRSTILPDYLKKCKDGPDNWECVKENAVAALNKLKIDGEPKYKLQSLSPFKLSEVNLQATPQLSIVIKNGEIHGFDSFEIKKGSFNSESLEISAHVNDKLDLIGDYEMNGRILILPIKGQGRCNLSFVDVDLDYKAKFHTIERKGKQYIQLKNEDSEATMKNIKRANFHFENLFDGDKRLGDEMNRFLDENWLEVFNEVKPAIEQTTAYAVINYLVNGFLRHIPLEDLFEK